MRLALIAVVGVGCSSDRSQPLPAEPEKRSEPKADIETETEPKPEPEARAKPEPEPEAKSVSCPPLQIKVDGVPREMSTRLSKAIEVPDTLKPDWPIHLAYEVLYQEDPLDCAGYRAPSRTVGDGISFIVQVNPVTKTRTLWSNNQTADADLEVVESPASGEIAICVRRPATVSVDWMGQKYTLEVSGLLRAKSCGTIPLDERLRRR